MFSKSLIQFAIDGWGCVPSLIFTPGQTMVKAMKIMVTSFKRCRGCAATLSTPDPAANHHQPTPPLETPGHLQASLGQSPVGSLLLSPGFWCTHGFVLPSKSLLSWSCGSSVIKSHLPPKSSSLRVLSPFGRSPGWEICFGP